MSLEYTFYFRKTQWAVYIQLTADAIPLKDEVNPNLISITDSLFVSYELETSYNKLIEVEKKYINEGLRRVADRIIAARKIELPILIRITGTVVILTDYQVTGFLLAIVGWASEYFGFEMPPFEGTFDREANQYYFWLEGRLLNGLYKEPKYFLRQLKYPILYLSNATFKAVQNDSDFRVTHKSSAQHNSFLKMIFIDSDGDIFRVSRVTTGKRVRWSWGDLIGDPLVEIYLSIEQIEEEVSVEMVWEMLQRDGHIRWHGLESRDDFTRLKRMIERAPTVPELINVLLESQTS